MENVLVVKTSLLSDLIGGRTGLLRDNTEELLSRIERGCEFIPRPDAENDPSYKQIIPYVILTRNGEVFCTRRLKKGTEARLHGLISMGIGGHINPCDGDAGDELLMRGLERELFEEVAIEKRGELIPCGFINDDSNAVGSVHLGLCYKTEVEGAVAVKETEKLEGFWSTAAELSARRGELETWADIALGAL